MKNTTNLVRTICEVGIFAALGFVFDELQGLFFGSLFPNGGSIGFAMIAVLIIGFRRGWLPAILTGLIMGLFDIATSAYIIHPAQLFLDYILPYALVGVGCVFKIPFDKSNNKSQKILWIIVATLVGGFLKFMSHYLAGVIFWANPENFAWNLQAMNPYLYCFIYNIAFMGPSILLSGGLLIAMYLRVPSIFSIKSTEAKEDKKKNVCPYAFASVISVGGLFCFVWFLIDYIKSFSSYNDEGAFGYDFNPDSMVIFLCGLFLVVLGVLSFIKIFKSRFSPLFSASVALTVVSISWIYSISRLIRMYVKGKNPNLYWLWFGVGLGTILVFVALVLYFYFQKKKDSSESNQSV